MKRKYFINHKYFDKIDTKDKAYWLGFLYADGCIVKRDKSLRLDLAEKDEEHLEKFKIALNSNYKIRTNKRISGNSKVLIINSSELINGLIKNFDRSRIPTIKENLIIHFLRGLFDGDGCIMHYPKRKSKVRISILASLELLQDIKSQTNLLKNKINNLGNIQEIRADGKQALNFIDKLYNNSSINIRLDRKFNKYQLMIDLYGGQYGIRNDE